MMPKHVRRFLRTHSTASPSKKDGRFYVVYENNGENPTKHENSLLGQSAGFLNVKAGGNSKHSVLNS